MPQTITKTVYSFEELSDAAKEKARDWWRDAMDSSDYQNVLEEAERFGETLGIDFKRHGVGLMNGTTRQDPNIWWSLSYSQGDGACFEGRYSYAKGAVAKLAADLGADHEVVKIAAGLQALQKAHGYRLKAIADQTDTHYSHEYTVSFEVTKGAFGYDGAEVSADVEKEVAALLRRFMKWIHNSLREEHEYLTSDEQVDETISLNEYVFEKDGSRSRDA